MFGGPARRTPTLGRGFGHGTRRRSQVSGRPRPRSGPAAGPPLIPPRRRRSTAAGATHGDDCLRAVARGLTEQAIGAEYIAPNLEAAVPVLPFDDDRRTTRAPPPQPRGGWGQVAQGAEGRSAAACGATSSSAPSGSRGATATSWAFWPRRRSPIGSRRGWPASRARRTSPS